MNPFLPIVSFLFVLTFNQASGADSSRCFKELPTLVQTGKYRTTVDVLNKHLSGILIFKWQDDQSIRTVFINEMGVTFFDLSFYADRYVYNSIMESLDKKAVRLSLAKDIGMLLKQGIFTPKSWNNPEILLGEAGTKNVLLKLQRKGKVLYTCNAECTRILSVTNLGRRKKVVQITPFYTGPSLQADSVIIQHQTVHFTIQLKKMYDSE
jgi:hypothetical protein